MTIAMTHEHVVENRIVEKYILRELSEEEIAAFEEHFCDCQICAYDVDALQTMEDVIRSGRT